MKFFQQVYSGWSILYTMVFLTSSINGEAIDFEARQLSTVPNTSSGGPTAKSSSTSSSQTSAASSSSSAVTASPSKVSLTVNMVLTTTFTQPTDCSGGITEAYADSTDLWQGLIDPAPAPSATVTTCLPPQFIASYLATTSLPPFKQMVCPYQWETYNVNGTYGICCPSGYGLYAPNYSNTQRPGLYAACTSSVWPNALMTITSFNSAGSTTVTVSSTSSVALVVAQAFDGNLYTGSASTTSSKSTSSTSSSIPTSSTSSSKSSSTTTVRSSSSKSSTTSSSSTITSSSTSSKSSSSTSSSTPSSSSSSSKSSSGTTTTTSKTSTTSSTKSTTASSTPSKTTSTSSTSTTTMHTTSTLPAESSLPSCGQTCFNNMKAQYTSLGCSSPDPFCLCDNVNFGYGIRDCSNGACGTVVASTVISYGSAYCTSATSSVLPPAASALPSCGWTCLGNMFGQYKSLGCAGPTGSCLCKNVNFTNGIRDCSNGACGTAIASTVISFGSSYCASATGTATT